MAATPGNEFWKLRSKHGRGKLFETPDLMWEAACEYFQWCVENPWMKAEQLKMPGKGYEDKDGNYIPPQYLIEIPTERPFTMQGLCQFLDCNTEYFNHFDKSLEDKTDQLSKDFRQIVMRIRETVYQQKFEGAAVGVFNSSIIARDLGLRDKVDNELSNPPGETFEITLKL